MNSKLRSLVVSIGLFVVGGVSYSVYRREPPGQPVANLRDAGLFSERDDRGRITPPCVIPDCSLPDGGWDDNGPPVDCYGAGPFGNTNGTPRWNGCNVRPTAFVTAADGGVPSQCVPVECSVVSGDGIDVLR